MIIKEVATGGLTFELNLKSQTDEVQKVRKSRPGGRESEGWDKPWKAGVCSEAQRKTLSFLGTARVRDEQERQAQPACRALGACTGHPTPHPCWLQPTQSQRSKSIPSTGLQVLCTNKKVPKFVSHFLFFKKMTRI